MAANYCTGANMRPVPDTGGIANAGTFIYNGCIVFGVAYAVLILKKDVGFHRN